MIFFYQGRSGFRSKFDIIVFNKVKVIATELDDNEGTSVTNCASEIATSVCKEFGIPFDKLIWIEHYPEGKKREETFDIVRFDVNSFGFCSPQWRRMGEEEIHSTIGSFLKLSPKEKWVIDFLLTTKNSVGQNEIDILDEKFVVSYIDEYNTKAEHVHIGAPRCRDLSSLLRNMFRKGLLNRKTRGVNPIIIKDGFPKWVYTYRIN